MAAPLSPIYPITDVELSGISSYLELVAELLRGGATWVQLREKRKPEGAILEQIEHAASYALDRGATLLVNDWVDVAQTTQAAGVHLGQADVPVETARSLLPDKIIGCSTHSLEQASAADRLRVDYIAIGPVFSTRTKTGNDPVGIAGVRQVRRAISKPLVAIGGITLANAAEVWDAGADSVAVIADIMTHRDIAGRVAAYLDFWRQLHS